MKRRRPIDVEMLCYSGINVDLGPICHVIGAALVAEMKERLAGIDKPQIEDHRAAMEGATHWLDLVMPNGKPVRDCTFGELNQPLVRRALQSQKQLG